MDFGLSDAQILLQRSLRDFLVQHVPIERVRSVMESERGSDPQILRELGEQDVLGLLVPESCGGLGLGLLDAVVAAQELGRAATPVSFHSGQVLAPLLLAAARQDGVAQEWLPRIASGETLVSVALAAAERRGDQLWGTLPYVPDAGVADLFLVATEGGFALVPSTSDGLDIVALATVDDTRRVAEVVLEGAPIIATVDLVDETAVTRAVDAARIALAADALGAAQEGLRIAVDYAKQREQFDRVIASFQAVKHMCAETFAAIDPVQALLWYAAWAWDEGDPEASSLAPLLKAHATEAATAAVTTCTQVFGGIGFTHECDMHLYFKRVGYDRQMLGGPTTLFRTAAANRHPGSASA